MPIYEYRCDACDRTLEVIQKFSDAPLEKCPNCQGPVKKLMSLGSFQLKGSGWYATDYKKSPATSSPSPTPAKEKEATPAAASPSPTKTGGGKDTP